MIFFSSDKVTLVVEVAGLSVNHVTAVQAISLTRYPSVTRGRGRWFLSVAFILFYGFLFVDLSFLHANHFNFSLAFTTADGTLPLNKRKSVSVKKGFQQCFASKERKTHLVAYFKIIYVIAKSREVFSRPSMRMIFLATLFSSTWSEVFFS